MLPAVAVGAALLLHGCGNPPLDVSGGTTPDYYSTLDPKFTSTTTTLTTTLLNTNIWELRRDMKMAVQTTHDLSGIEVAPRYESIYESCWAAGAAGGVTTLAGGKKTYGYLEDWNDQFWEDGQLYGNYMGDTGVNLKSKHNLSSDGSGCLMRKSRLPIDFTKIQRMELDIQTSGTAPTGPWFGVWLSPLLANTLKTPPSVALDAEIDIIENHGAGSGWEPVNALSSQFSLCGNPGEPASVSGLCRNKRWFDVQAARMNHHFTVEVNGDGAGKIVSACGCRGTGTGETCQRAPDNCATISVGAGVARDANNFRAWRDDIGPWKGHYWLVADIWQTLDWDQGQFQLFVDNVTFWDYEGKQWLMPLGGHFITNDTARDPSVPEQYNDIAADVDDDDGPEFIV
jgi:hypothetical protein